MTTSKLRRWRGVAALVRDAVEHGSRAIERVQIESARRPFTVLEHIPVVAAPTKVVHVAHDISVKVVHGMIRGVNAVVGTSIDVVLEQVDKRSEDSDSESPDESHSSDGASDHRRDDAPVDGSDG